MQWNPTAKWAPRAAAFAAALLLGASTVYWVLHWPASVSGRTDAPALAQSALPAANLVAVSGLLGAGWVTGDAAPAPVSPNRFRLVGVLARSGGGGSAIIAIDGMPPKSFRVGSEVLDGIRLQSVAPRRATLTSGPDAANVQTLEMPAPITPN